MIAVVTNILAYMYLRKNMLTLEQGFAIQVEAEILLADSQFEARSLDVLQLAEARGCVAYDCESVVLAKVLNVRLVMEDKKVLAAFPSGCVRVSRMLQITSLSTRGYEWPWLALYIRLPCFQANFSSINNRRGANNIS